MMGVKSDFCFDKTDKCFSTGSLTSGTLHLVRIRSLIADGPTTYGARATLTTGRPDQYSKNLESPRRRAVVMARIDVEYR